MKKITLVLLVFSVALISCNKNASINGNVALKISASTATGKTSVGGRLATSSSGRTQSVVSLTSVKVNFGEIKFEVDEDHRKSPADSVYEDVKLKGPFLVDLLSANAFIDRTITSLSIPNGNYKEIEFKFAKVNSTDAMNGKSISISGTIDGKAFEFWSDTTEELKIDFRDKNKNVIISNNDLSLAIKMHLDQLLALIQNAVSAGLTDKNNNGKIEIDPKNSDGNKDLHDLIKHALENETELEDGK